MTAAADSSVSLPTASDVSPPLRFAVMGAGAVGCYFGALLARAGHAVTLIGRPAPGIGERIVAVAPRDKLHIFDADGRGRIEL